MDPNLTVPQIRNILSSTADKVGGVNYNWDANRPGHSRELGFGRLNANAALNAVFPSITGPGFVCTDANYFVNFSALPTPPGFPPQYPLVFWEASSNLSIPPKSVDRSVTVTKSGGNGLGYIQASATKNGCTTTVRKQVQVGPEYANFSISAYPYCASPGEVVDFIAEIQNVNYNWTVNGGTLLGGQGTQFIYAQMVSETMAVHCAVTGTSAENCIVRREHHLFTLTNVGGSVVLAPHLIPPPLPSMLNYWKKLKIPSQLKSNSEITMVPWLKVKRYKGEISKLMCQI